MNPIITIGGNEVGIVRKDNIPFKICDTESEKEPIKLTPFDFGFEATIDTSVIELLGALKIEEPNPEDELFKFYMRRGKTYYFKNKYSKGKFTLRDRMKLKVGTLIKIEAKYN